MTDPIRAALNKLEEYDDANPYHDCRDLIAAARAQPALAADALQQIAHAASHYLCGKRFPPFAEEHGGLDILEANLARLLAHVEHGPQPVPGVDVPGPDGDYGGLQELCDAEGVDVRIGAPLLRRARKAWKDAANVHYEWELVDAAGVWQDGGSSNSLDDVESEGKYYLQTFSQDGPHKLIIRQHSTVTIDEIAND